MIILSFLITVVTLNYLYYDFPSAIYEYKDSISNSIIVKKLLPSFLCFTVLITFINTLNIPLLNLITNYIVINLISFRYFKIKSLSYMFIMNAIFFSFVIFIDMMAYPISSIISNNVSIIDLDGQFYQFLVSILFSILMIGSYGFVKVFLKSNKSYVGIKTNLIISFFLPSFSILVIYTIMTNSNFDKTSFIYLSICICLGLVFLNIYLVKLFEVIYSNRELKERIQTYKNISKLQLAYYNNLSAKNSELNHHIHDTKRHIQMIKHLYENEQPNVVNNYISDIYKSYELSTDDFNSENIVLKILLSDKINKAKQENVNLRISAIESDLLFIDDVDIVMIFSNLIDNAIEATRGCSNKEVHLSIVSHSNFILINIQNNYNEIKRNKKGLFLSTKENHFGCGLDIINKTVEKYDGTITIEYKDVFTVNILLPVPIPSK